MQVKARTARGGHICPHRPRGAVVAGFTGTWNVGIGAAAGAGKVQMNGLVDNAAATINVLPNATVYSSAAVTLRLRSDRSVTFPGGNNFGGLGTATITIDVDRKGSGSEIGLNGKKE